MARAAWIEIESRNLLEMIGLPGGVIMSVKNEDYPNKLLFLISHNDLPEVTSDHPAQHIGFELLQKQLRRYSDNGIKKMSSM